MELESPAAHWPELADQGIDVELFDQMVSPGVSRMQASALHCRLLGDLSATAEFRARAYHHARPLLTNHPLAKPSARYNWLSRLRGRQAARIAAIYATAQSGWLRFLDAQATLDELGLEARSAPLFKQSAIINLPHLCGALIDHPRIKLVRSTGQGQPDVIACASASRDMASHLPLEIGDVFGQLNWITPPATATLGPLNVAILGNGYVLPGPEHWVIGSTYEQSPGIRMRPAPTILTATATFSVQIPPRQFAINAARCVSSDRPGDRQSRRECLD